MADGGLHVFPRFVVERQGGGVVLGDVPQGPVGSAVGEGAGFAVGRESVHLFFLVQEGELHFDFNCTVGGVKRSRLRPDSDLLLDELVITKVETWDNVT